MTILRWQSASVLLIAALFAYPLISFNGVRAAAPPTYCDALPKVPWWGKTKDIPSYVRRVHYGDWNAYVAKWQAQLDRMEFLDINRFAAASPDRRHVLRGSKLKEHIEKIRQRLEITTCLARGGQPIESISSANGKVEQTLRLAGDPVEGNVKAEQLGCNSCHGTDPPAAHPAIPHLAGQNAFYLMSQLRLYRRDSNKATRTFSLAARHEEFMDHFAQGLTENAIYDLAAYYAGLACVKTTEASNATRPADFIRGCEDCHGINPKQYFPETPRLSGQKPKYLMKQLRRFRFYATEPDRPTHPEKRYHFAMSREAEVLTNDMIAEAARYYSSQSCAPN